ncbi:hypothetical protein Q3G72_022837 [Acer saccharum]|nr:hypothetical protein Q3G72_022837 [Acer saccharum]
MILRSIPTLSSLAGSIAVQVVDFRLNLLESVAEDSTLAVDVVDACHDDKNFILNQDFFWVDWCKWFFRKINPHRKRGVATTRGPADSTSAAATTRDKLATLTPAMVGEGAREAEKLRSWYGPGAPIELT